MPFMQGRLGQNFGGMGAQPPGAMPTMGAQTASPPPDAGLMNPGAMQFIHAMMSQPGANFGAGGMPPPTYGTPFAFGVPQFVTPPAQRVPPVLPPTGGNTPTPPIFDGRGGGDDGGSKGSER